MRRAVLGAAAISLCGCERSSTAPPAPPQTTMVIESSWSPPDSGVVGQLVAGVPAVRVTDGQGLPLAELEVTFVPTLRASPSLPYSATTDANGVATYASGWVLSGRPGRQELLVVPRGSNGIRTVFAVEAKADTAAQMTMSFGGVSTLSIGDSVSPTFAFADVFGNPSSSTGTAVYEFSDSTVLASSGQWIRAIAPGASQVVARIGSLSAVSSLGVRVGSPVVSVDRLMARSGFGMAIDANRVLYTTSITYQGITRLDLTTETPLSTIGTGTYWNVAEVPARGEIWAVRYDQPLLDVFSVATGGLLRSVGLPFPGLRILPSPDGSVVYVTSYETFGGMMRVRTSDGGVVYENFGDQVNGIAFSRDGSRLYTTDVGEGLLREHDPTTLEVLRAVDVSGYPQEILVDSSARRILVMREFAPMAILDDSTLAALPGSPPSFTGAYGAAFSASGEYIIVASLNLGVRIFDAATLEAYDTVSALRARRIVIDPGSGRAWIVQESADELISLTLVPPGSAP